MLSPSVPQCPLVSLGFPQCESVLAAGFDADGRVTRCSSIRLACERMMRLKKSSSGTVGPRIGGAVGGAQRWSSNREPCWWRNSFTQHKGCSHFPRLRCVRRVTYLALDQHVEEVVVGLGAVGVGHEVAEHGLVAVLVEPEAWQAAPGCRRLLQPPALGPRDVCRL